MLLKLEKGMMSLANVFSWMLAHDFSCNSEMDLMEEIRNKKIKRKLDGVCISLNRGFSGIKTLTATFTTVT